MSFPTAIDREENGDIRILWDDGLDIRWRPSELRKACPCATCREKKRQPEPAAAPRVLPVISAAEARPMRVESMRPVGNYAYNLAFSDGHQSGIFSFALLRRETPGLP